MPNSNQQFLEKIARLEKNQKELRDYVDSYFPLSHGNLKNKGNINHEDIDFHMDNRHQGRKHLPASNMNGDAYKDATLTVKGIVELATDAETLTGTDTGRVITPSNLEYARAQSGWIPITDTWTYASADAPSFVITVPSDATTKYSVGMRIKLTQTTTKYFFVTAVAATTLTVYGGTDYTLANATITLPYYSTQKAPLGFPLQGEKWQVEVEVGQVAQSSPTAGVWYNFSSITVPIGSWRIGYQAEITSIRAATSDQGMFITLSNANNSESYPRLTARNYASATGFSRLSDTVAKERRFSATTKTILYLNGGAGLAGLDSIRIGADDVLSIIYAISDYL